MKPILSIAATALFSAGASAQSPVLVSSDQAGIPANGQCSSPDASFDGHWVAFSTGASNMSPTGFNQVFLKDLATWGVELVSLSTGGAAANHLCLTPRVSWDGRFVIFSSRASNLVGGDTNANSDVFLRDRWTGVTTRESLGSSGGQLFGTSLGTDLSYDGRFVLFHSSAANVVPGAAGGISQHYLRDRLTGQVQATALSSSGAVANKSSEFLAGGVSGDGRYVVFSSPASNLVSGDTNGLEDVFLRDTWAGSLVRLSESPGGQGGNGASTLPYISDDGRFVVFTSYATNFLTPDLNGADSDVFVHEIGTGALELVSVSTAGVQGDWPSIGGGISWDGRYVSFDSQATNLISEPVVDWDGFVHDRVTGVTELVTPPTFGYSSPPTESAISPNGRFPLIRSLEPWDPAHPASTWQIYVTDRGPVCWTPQAYCAGKVNSLGCTPWVASFGCSSATQTEGFFVYGGNVRNNKVGLLFYGVNGQAANPFQGGTMCVNAPKKRTPVRDSGGNPPPADDCSGLWVIDMNQFAAGLGGGNPLPALSVPGTTVDCQWWGRDPGAPFDTSLTNALEYLVGL